MKPVVRALIVTDDGPAKGGFLQWTDQTAADALGMKSREFHLGEFVRVLKDTTWVGFTLEMTKAYRTIPHVGAADEANLKTERGADVVNFNFNQSFQVNGQSRTLADYDMVFYFSIREVPPSTNATILAEVEAISQFMESGKGFFATGDHFTLGSELCGVIPRVRNMRRWWPSTGPNGEPAAPPPLGPTRHDTTRPGADLIGQFEDQSDEFAQEITPTLYSAGLTIRQGYPATRYYPHPLLCSPEGMVTYLPDHMHEGWCEVPNNLDARTFKIGAATLREYPDYTPPSPPPGYVASALAPEIVATSHILPGTKSPALDTKHTGSPDPANEKTFGAIGAWDGHLVSRGRVVVDATWHHFFNINLTGDRFLEDNVLPPAHQQKLHGFFVPDGSGGRAPNHQYKMIMWYFRNIVYWLIPAHRNRRIAWQILVDISRRPRFVEELPTIERSYERLTFEHYAYFGQLAEEYLAMARGGCATYDIHRYIYEPEIPWYEWIQEIVDVWAPVQVRNIRARKAVEREQMAGALGAGPRADVAVTLSLGAAIVTAGLLRPLFAEGAESPEVMAAVGKVWPGVLDHAVSEFGKELALGAKAQRKIEKAIAAQTKKAE